MIDMDRCFRMSVLNALDGLLVAARLHPGTELDRVAETLCAGNASEAGFDYKIAISILAEVPELTSVSADSRELRLRSFLMHLLLKLRPAWCRLVPKGRAYVHAYLDEDARAVFRNAGLYGDVDTATREWWDRLGCSVRTISDEHLLELGRRGELLTLQYERDRLSALGRTDLQPDWVGFEDNSLGYDVRSYTITESGLIPKYIEVKAATNEDLRFYLTRNEWRVAERFSKDFLIHLWDIASEQLYEITFNELSAHVPQDMGRGNWDAVIIRWR